MADDGITWTSNTVTADIVNYYWQEPAEQPAQPAVTYTVTNTDDSIKIDLLTNIVKELLHIVARYRSGYEINDLENRLNDLLNQRGDLWGVLPEPAAEIKHAGKLIIGETIELEEDLFEL